MINRGGASIAPAKSRLRSSLSMGSRTPRSSASRRTPRDIVAAAVVGDADVEALAALRSTSAATRCRTWIRVDTMPRNPMERSEGGAASDGRK